jgi:hypothetical protein
MTSSFLREVLSRLSTLGVGLQGKPVKTLHREIGILVSCEHDLVVRVVLQVY